MTFSVIRVPDRERDDHIVTVRDDSGDIVSRIMFYSIGQAADWIGANHPTARMIREPERYPFGRED